MNETINKIPGEILEVPAAKMFSYPTYLADAWTPRILQIYRPEYQSIQPGIEYQVVEGTTDSINYVGASKKEFLLKNYKKLTPPLKIEDDRVFFDARYIFQDNVAHMIINVMPVAVHIANNGYPNLNVILHKEPKKFTLKVCELMGIPALTTDKEVQGKLIKATDFNKAIVPDKFYRSILPLYAEKVVAKDQYEIYPRVLIGRKGSRKITNESEVEILLKDYGFKKVYYEDIPMEQQWLISKHAEIIVGIHGAAFGALMFNQSRVKVIEIFHPGYVVYSIRNIVACVGGTWCGVTGQMPETFSEAELAENPRKFADASITVNLDSLRLALDYMDVRFVEARNV
ncbi:DUF563 domain-containing protein [Gloeocapsa sp. PCC 73106]|uniref:glycosyltransferase family 61 protein n=1 Tax=Gloeocapsa sp. PCC 73106 TaxID=102232 RepID=UPI0002AC8967|nr:glycosyltransferase 61 family protein [Gloeocapsa sp. PCC 73106]ELR96548.1 hypothetical protein GLO73106DRAFT_00003430 [Gloeocapsa sp. PCC 73106]